MYIYLKNIFLTFTGSLLIEIPHESDMYCYPFTPTRVLSLIFDSIHLIFHYIQLKKKIYKYIIKISEVII